MRSYKSLIPYLPLREELKKKKKKKASFLVGLFYIVLERVGLSVRHPLYSKYLLGPLQASRVEVS
jgi:hypothetical protein